MVYLKDIEKSIIANASDRDITLYHFLKGESHSVDFSKNDIESELYQNSFTNGGGQEALEKLRKAQPFKGFHYSSNLVLLIAAANIDFSNEEENIIKYLKNHSYKEQVIINEALERSFTVTNNADTPIQKLAKSILNKTDITEREIQNGLSSVDDLYDLYIVEKAVVSNITTIKELKNIKAYIKLVEIGSTAFRRIEHFIYFITFIVFLYVVIKVGPFLVDKLVSSWDYLEPLAYLADKVITIILLVTGVVVVSKIKKVKLMLKTIVLTTVFKILGVNYRLYKGLLEIVQSDEKKT